MNSTRLYVWITSLLIACPSSFGAIEFRVEGRFDIYANRKANPYESGDLNPKVFGDFSVTVSNCLWVIRYSQSDEPRDYTEIGTDGNRIFTLLSIVHQTPVNKSGKAQFGVNKEIGFVDPGPYPNPANGMTASVLWWCYASTCYLNTNQDRLFYPIWYPEKVFEYGLFVKNIRLPGVVERHFAPPRLPSDIVIMDDGFSREWPRPDAQTIPELMTQKRREAPFSNGFTNTIISLSDFTPAGALALPKRALATFYAPAPKGRSSNDLVPLRTYNVSVTNLTDTIAPNPFVPTVSHAIFVSDYRFARTETPVQVGYLTDSRWLSDDEVRARPEYKKQVELQPVQKESTLIGIARDKQRRSGGWLVFALFVMALAPIFIFVFLRSGRITESQKH